MTPEQELNESGEKGIVTGIILSKRKGGIKCLQKAFKRLFKGLSGLKQILKGLSKAFETPFTGLSKTFKMPFKDL